MASDWANLPNHLLDSILKNLVSRLDYIRFNVVCMSWYCVAKDNKKNFDEISSCHNPPLLLIQTTKKRDWNLYNPMEDKVLGLQLKFPKKRLCGSSKGWLIAMNMNLVVTLINPILRIKGRKKRQDSIINLPPLARLPERDMSGVINSTFVIKATVSADPILDADKCIVIVIYEPGKLAFIRLKKDTTWTYIDERFLSIQDVVHVADKFYVVEETGRLFSFDIITQSISNKQLVAGDSMECFDEVLKTYLVVLNDNELLMVQRGVRFNTGRVTTEVRIFKLNFEKYEWIETKTLGDIALFLGDNFSIFVMASNFSGCRPNCIYFNYDYDRINSYPKNRLHDDYSVYNIESRSFSQSYTWEAKRLLEKTMQPSYWVVPTLQL